MLTAPLRPLLLALLALCAGGAAYGQLVLETTSTTRMPALSAKSLQLIPIGANGTDGTSQADATANAAALNAYSDDGWLAQKLAPQLPGAGFCTWNPWVIDKEGFPIYGTGGGDTRAEVEFAAYGGMPARIVGVNPDMPCVIDYSGLGATAYGLSVAGGTHPTDGGVLKADTANHVAIGILQRCGNGVTGAGKWHGVGPTTLSVLGEGIRLGDSALGDNADQWNLQSLRTPDCVVGIHSICRQSVGHWIGQYEGTRTGTMLWFERGGKLRVDQITVENANPTMLRCRAQLIDDGSFSFGEVYVDGSVSGNVTLIQMDAHVPLGDDGIDNPPNTGDDEQAAATRFTFDYLDIVSSVAAAPKVKLRGYPVFHVRSGDELYDTFIEVNATASTFFATIIIENCRFRTGEDPTDVIDAANSAGKARVILRNNSNLGGVPFDDETFFIKNGVKSDTDPDARLRSPLRLRHRLEPIETLLAMAA